MIPRYGKPPVRGTAYRLRPGAYAVLVRGREVLLTATDEIQLPGGGIDPGESPLHALHREVFEETGWSLSGPRRLGAFRRFVWMPDYGFNAEKLCHVYVARPGRRLGPPTEPDHAPLWLPLRDALDALDDPGDRSFLARHLRTAGLAG
ncbi:NUDIX hydrolase [Roseicyclus sp. F158]|uniref:NUDIX hydrolase n=1 Tax=Tropicimonas omnivorans TaxID=3075590 RepID=A0ABU3DCS1_9RHOB|nr:NUDIX hydrolase [Roseicyclus sp. F158]MDT0681501.1 NUDIX hydrolase [Roseicyclus sp. F158]